MDGLDPEQLAPMVKNLSNADQQEIMTLLNRSQQQAQVGEIVHSLSLTCFKKCITSKISADTLTGGEQACAQNCVSRWLDVQQSIMKNLSGQQVPSVNF